MKAFFNKKIIIIEQLLNYGRISCAACLLLAKMKVKIPETNVNRNGNKDYLLHFFNLLSIGMFATLLRDLKETSRGAYRRL